MTEANKKGVAEIAVAHPRPDVGQALLMEAFGTADMDFANGLIRQLADAGKQGQTLDERDLNSCSQGSRGSNQEIRSNYARGANGSGSPRKKPARSFAAQVEALNRYRTGGQQKVTVDHVTVTQENRDQN